MNEKIEVEWRGELIEWTANVMTIGSHDGFCIWGFIIVLDLP